MEHGSRLSKPSLIFVYNIFTFFQVVHQRIEKIIIKKKNIKICSLTFLHLTKAYFYI